MLHETRRGRNVCKNSYRQMPVKWLLSIRNRIVVPIFLAVFLFFQYLLPGELQAGEYLPAVNGMSLNLGYAYDPSDDIWFSQISIFRLYDYDSIWPHNAPESLRFKIEGSLGGARLDNSDIRMTASVNIFALFYLPCGGNNRIRPYAEAGIGGIYTDYRVDGQDYRFNFNPQAGIGMEIEMGQGINCFGALRIHHLSNGAIGSVNRGQNSLICLFGRYF